MARLPYFAMSREEATDRDVLAAAKAVAEGGQRVSAAAIEARVGVTYPTVVKTLKRLEADGLIVRSGKKKETDWRPVDSPAAVAPPRKKRKRKKYKGGSKAGRDSKPVADWVVDDPDFEPPRDVSIMPVQLVTAPAPSAASDDKPPTMCVTQDCRLPRQPARDLCAACISTALAKRSRINSHTRELS